MVDTVRTIPFLLASEFNGGISAHITAQFMRDLTVTLGSLTQNAITPQMYGAKGDGSTDDTVALNNAALAAGAALAPLVIPTGVYMTTGFTISSDATIPGNSPLAVIGAGNWNSIIRAKAGATSPLVKFINGTQTTIRDLGIDGDGLVGTCLDTTWNASFGPSLQNVYDHLEIRGYTTQGWKAQANNDCGFRNCLMDGGSNPGCTAMFIDAHGGNVSIHECGFFSSNLVWSAQSMQMVDCVTTGLRAGGFDFNECILMGGYHYADSVTGINFDTPNTFATKLSAFGARMENNVATTGRFIGGSTAGGQLVGGATMIGCRFLNTTAGGTGTLKIIDTNLATGLNAGLFGTVRLQDCMISSNITLTSVANFNVVTFGCIGDFSAVVMGTETWRVGRSDYTDLLQYGMQCVNSTYGDTGAILSVVVTASSGAHGTVADIPQAGTCIITHMNAGAGVITPATQFRYMQATLDTAFSQAGAGSTTVAGSIAGSGENYTLTITPSSASAAQYLVTIFGAQ